VSKSFFSLSNFLDRILWKTIKIQIDSDLKVKILAACNENMKQTCYISVSRIFFMLNYQDSSKQIRN